MNITRTRWCPRCVCTGTYEFVGDVEQGAQMRHMCGHTYILHGEYLNNELLQLIAHRKKVKP